ncbi:MAG: hypothetical protein WC312_00435 [Candidatus Omnitrophota bacterium]|jgi:transcription initiation factor IIE alpha subunit
MKKKTVKKAGRKTKKAEKGMKYVCDECGMAVTVNDACSCTDVCDITCCGRDMRLVNLGV